jgi:hypothetical protein
MSDAQGRVDGSIPGLADLARVSIEQCQAALKCLSGPDFFSRTKEHEGRRIQDIDGGWQILNYLKYRESGSDDLRRIKNREAVKRFRAKRNITVIKSNGGNGLSSQAEAEAEASQDSTAAKPRAVRLADDEFVAELGKRAAYAGLDVKTELGKAQTWCEVRNRKCSRQFFVNWLNRAEKPISTHGNKTDNRPNSRRYENMPDYSGIQNHGLVPKP